jgi:hypothetical protein
MPMPTDGYAPVRARLLVEVATTADLSEVFRYDSTVILQATGMNASGDTVLTAIAATVIDQVRSLLDPTVPYTTSATITYSGDCDVDALPATGGV